MNRQSHLPQPLSLRHAIWLALIVSVIGLTGSAGVAQGQAPGARALFAPAGEGLDQAPGLEQAERVVKRGRRVRANLDALLQADGAEVLLNLFDDVQLRARRSRLESSGTGGAVWRGQLLDVTGEATIAFRPDGVMAATVHAGDRVFEILYAGGGEHDVREIDPAEFPTDDPEHDAPGVEPDPQADEMDAAVDAGIAGDSASQIDVMVVWTPAARTAAGGTSAIQSLVDLAVANTNNSYSNSAVTQRIRLVYAGEISYTESGISTDLSRITGTTDGHMDAVHSLRNTYGADVVTLLGNGYASAGACGVGYLMSYVSTGFASTAFNVVDRTCAAGNLSYAHELGHNMGLQHDPANASSTPAYSYAFGYQDPGGSFRTVMSYGGAPRIQYFSNPSRTYGGKVTGTSTQNNALALNNTASSVANFRQAVTGTCSYSLGTTSASVASGAATGTVSVSAGSGCAWTAASNASWLTVTSGASGSANGTVGYSVAANTAGTSRTGTLTIAGRTFTVTQAAAACTAFSLSPTSASATASGGPLSVSVSGMTGCARTATSNAGWITVTSGASGTGSGTVALSVAANTVASTRSGTVTIGGQTFTVNQAAAACGAFSLSPTSASATSAGGTVTVNVTGTSGCARTATSNAAWITVTAGASATGSGSVSLGVAANPAGTTRSGTVTIGGKTFTVNQAAAACTAFSLSPTSGSIASGGGPLSVTVTGMTGCSRTAASNSSWITVTSGATGTGSGTVALSVAANPTALARTGSATIAGQVYTVSQAAAACTAFTIAPTSASVGASGGPVSVSVTGMTGCSRTASSNAGWITVSSGATGSGSGTVVLSVAANTVGTSRSGTATIAGRTFTVTQAAAACGSFSLSPTSANATSAGGTVTVNVTGTSGCTRTATSNAAWITVNSGATGTGSGTVALSVAANAGLTMRSGTATIGGQTYTVTQAAAVCGYTLSATDVTIQRTGGSASVVVGTSSSQCVWSAIKDASWISVSGSTSRTGSGTLSFSVPSHSGKTARTGHIVIAGQILTVTQLGKPRNQALDFNLDGVGDALLYDPSGGAWRKETLTSGSFDSAAEGQWGPGWAVYPADFNADDRSDLFLYNETTGDARKLVSLGDGTFATTSVKWAPGWSVTVLDLDGDRHSDLFLYNKVTGMWTQVQTLPATGGFTYKQGWWAPGWTVTRAVFNTDGRDDLFLFNDDPTSANAGLWFRVLTGSNLVMSYLPGNLRWASYWTVVPGDFNGDGLSEIFLYDQEGGRWFVVTFTSNSVAYSTGTWSPGLTLHRAEFNKDGRADLFLYDPAGGSYGLAVSQGNGTFTVSGGLWAGGWQVAITDLNLDDVSDILLYHPVLGSWAQVVAVSPTSLSYRYGTFGQGWSMVGSHVVLP